ncbi:MAG TPA: hypothetical protein VGD64_10895 [Acidisarcina sp.]
MYINSIQANTKALDLAHAIADNFQASVGGVARGAVVEHNSGGYRAYVVPSVPGGNASGSTVSEAEANLAMVLDILA